MPSRRARVTDSITDWDEYLGLTVEETSKSQNNSIRRLSGIDSDVSSFLHHAGIPSIDMYYGADYPVYHTAFDTYDWMVHNADPLFHRHVTMAGIWGLLGIILADEPLIPFNYISYAEQLQRRELNDRLMLAERGFLDAEGIRGNEWFKHLLLNQRPNLDFPGIADAIAMNASEGIIEHEIWRVTSDSESKQSS